MSKGASNLRQSLQVYEEVMCVEVESVVVTRYRKDLQKERYILIVAPKCLKSVSRDIASVG